MSSTRFAIFGIRLASLSSFKNACLNLSFVRDVTLGTGRKYFACKLEIEFIEFEIECRILYAECSCTHNNGTLVDSLYLALHIPNRQFDLSLIVFLLENCAVLIDAKL